MEMRYEKLGCYRMMGYGNSQKEKRNFKMFVELCLYLNIEETCFGISVGWQ